MYDQKCEDLAIHFLPRDASPQSVMLLAAHIQEEIEDWIKGQRPIARWSCNCGFIGLRHATNCPVYPLTAEGGFSGTYPPGGGDDDSDIW